MWLGEQITDRGIGNGISLIIFAGIIVGLPQAIFDTFVDLQSGSITLFAVLALLVGSNRWLSRGLHLVNTIIMAGFVERSWQTLAVERGWVFGDCDMESGLPSWFALDKWFPAIFEVQTACGYTPLILFNITMAEVLMVVSSSLLGASLVLLAVSLRGKHN